jgi:hypothetical protein
MEGSGRGKTFKVLYRNLPGGTEENHENRSRYPVSRPRQRPRFGNKTRIGSGKEWNVAQHINNTTHS